MRQADKIVGKQAGEIAAKQIAIKLGINQGLELARDDTIVELNRAPNYSKPLRIELPELDFDLIYWMVLAKGDKVFVHTGYPKETEYLYNLLISWNIGWIKPLAVKYLWEPMGFRWLLPTDKPDKIAYYRPATMVNEKHKETGKIVEFLDHFVFDSEAVVASGGGERDTLFIARQKCHFLSMLNDKGRKKLL
ncbi:hypothetical protein CONCODRAFT_72160 [Conidiobolus coronatus NRRL 28638]|uniref:Uncharacterized protein n=1 Tax=Conidiobolus coronatus (strain ATCC 28846 / CBS 209.66 / NRRL 28638) TaxID=796925 RepID=A0A137P0K4_CONC2|nr:hypothetical protein CONCODRAFT_72160 [Conidiobolus coronatus NRRL 28638]|eukprot:KXN68576.1 hypothetical protein CONCODRAFT_72160 [Conidiobolus coronatus NRRL 28638]